MKHDSLLLLPFIMAHAFSATATEGLQQYNIPLPQAIAFYDFDGSSEKGFVSCYATGEDMNKSTLYFHNGFSKNFSPNGTTSALNSTHQTYGPQFAYVTGIDDVNGDGIPDIGVFASEQFSGNLQWAAISNGSGQYDVKSMVLFNNYDINRDGRTDLAEEIRNGANTYTRLHHFTRDGSLLSTPMLLVAYEDYQGDFDAASWMEMKEAEAVNKTLGYNPWSILTGAALEPNTDPTPSTLPDMALDLNGDGYADLVEAATGTLYYGTPEGKYVVSTVGGAACVRDLNDDGVSDYVIYGGEQGVVKTLIYQGGGEFKETALIDNLAADSPVWCYDFDRDGDVDILVTFSAYNTDGITSYTLFYENDGNGNFIPHEDYVEKNYIYSTCRDIDNDGYYDLLLLELDESYSENWQQYNIINVLVRRGGAGFTLGEAEKLYSFTTNENIFGLKDNIPNYTVEAEDIDGDGIVEIWVSHKFISRFFDGGQQVYFQEGVQTANTAPNAPQRLSANYNAATGKLKISWGEAADSQSSSKDLTYAVRIGSTPGGSDMVNGHALANGTRRNFMDGNAGSSLEKTLDLRSWPSGTYYVSVQAIDPNHAGSAWSEEISFRHTYIPVEFTLSSTQTSTALTLDIHYTVSDGMTHSWQLDGADIKSENYGLMTIQWDKPGTKEIIHTMTASDGTQATSRQTVSVMANWLASSDNNPFYRNYYPQFFDYDNDGLVDFVAPVADNAGLYHNDGNGTFSKAKGIFNQGLSFSKCAWVDWNMDGKADVIYYDYATQKHGLLLNNGNGNFTKQSNVNISVPELPIDIKADFNNDGLVDFTGYGLYRNDGDGTFTYIEATEHSDKFQRIVDWDADGLLDSYYLYSDRNNYTALTVYHNLGNMNFEKIDVPFETPVPRTEFAAPTLTDFDNDGYYDLLFWRGNGNIEVLKNEGNTKFVSAYTIQTGLTETASISYEGDYCNYSLFDLDNNGYEDVLITSYDANRQDSLSVYAVYVDSPGNYRQGFISDACKTTNAIIVKTLESGKAPVVSHSPDYQTDLTQNNTTVANTRPQPPTTVAARQTTNGLHIEWSAATDAETPTKKLRYNLSVKKKGATGANSYIISPLNGGSNATGPYAGMQVNSPDKSSTHPNCYHFIRATQFEIPVDRMPAGEYEIQVQTIDLWGETSDFSAPVTIKMETAPLISAPTILTAGQTALISYIGTRDESVEPVWDFDGADFVEGSSYGPYRVSWNNFGNKTVSVAVGNAQSSTVIGVTRWYDVGFAMPQEVYFNSEFTIALHDIPKTATLRWELSGENNEGEDLEINAVAGETSATARIVGHPELTNRRLTLYTTIDGNEQQRYLDFTVLPEIEAPTLQMVESDGNRNVVTWDAQSLPESSNEIIVYKEGSVLNDFTEIGRAGKSEGRFTDMTADNTVRSERYAIAMTLVGGETSRMSQPHQTVLLTINRGLVEGSYNLIWNPYQGRDIASYRILRGTAPDALQEIAVLAGSATSFIDQSPGSMQYYALELIPADNPQRQKANAQDMTDGGVRSNVVYAGNAANIDYVTDLRIVSLQGNTSITEDQPAAYLYAEILPLSADYQRVVWEVIDGPELAAVNSYGVVTALPNTTGGYATIKASTTDGSGTEATIQLWIDPKENSGMESTAADDIYLNAWPLPADNVLHLSASGEIEQLWLYNSSGTLVKGITQPGITQINTGGLPTGLYILRVRMHGGNEALMKVLKK